MKSEIEMSRAKADIHEKIASAATNHDLTHMELLSIINQTQAWVIELASRSSKQEIEASVSKPAAPARVCPFCGSTEQIYSVYRDGGSTLYHARCGRDNTWKNPDFKRPEASWGDQPKADPFPASNHAQLVTWATTVCREARIDAVSLDGSDSIQAADEIIADRSEAQMGRTKVIGKYLDLGNQRPQPER